MWLGLRVTRPARLSVGGLAARPAPGTLFLVGKRHGLALAFGVVFAAFGTLGAVSGSAAAMVLLFAGLILVAVGVDRI